MLGLLNKTFMKPFTFVKIEWFFLVMNANLMLQCEANRLLKGTGR